MNTPNEYGLKENYQWLRSIFTKPIVDLGESGNEFFSGIFSPGYDQEEIKRFMSETYSSEGGASATHQKLKGINDYYHNLLSKAILKIGFDGSQPIDILELGCGSGSATIPILQLFPNSRLVATELSIPMLSILNVHLRQENYANYLMMQLNAEELDFHQNSFDLIFGSAILHHLFTPEKTLGQCWDILKPGGAALFFEPFESGFSILSLIYKEILLMNQTKKGDQLNPAQISYLQNYINIWKKMSNQNKSDPFFDGLDDKWSFTKPYFERAIERYPFSKLVIYPIHETQKPFENLIKTHTQGNSVDLPGWAWEIVDAFEEHFSADLKTDLLTEGAVILIK